MLYQFIGRYLHHDSNEAIEKTTTKMTTTNFTIGQRVEKLGSAKDYATGRKGTVVELPNETNTIEPDRIRVNWDTNPSGTPMKPIKTKVNRAYLKALTNAECCCEFNPNSETPLEVVNASNCCPVHNANPWPCFASSGCGNNIT